MKPLATVHSIIKSETLPEMLSKISWKMLSLLALIPALIFTATPIYQLIYGLINPPEYATCDITFVDDSGTSTTQTFVVGLVGGYHYVKVIDAITPMVLVLGVILILCFLGKWFTEHRGMRNLVKDNVPSLWFLLFVVGMIVTTCINGFTDQALTGNYYANESLLTYCIYVLIYFFCGTMLYCAGHKRFFFYSILTVSLVLGIAELINIYLVEVPAYRCTSGYSAVFYNSNHYGYFLTMAIALAGALFVTEKKWSAKIFCIFTFLLNMVVLLLNDTFGCYLAVGAALVLQLVFFSVREKKFSWLTLVPMAGFALVSGVMSIWYDTVFQDVVRLISDLVLIGQKDEDAGGAGSGRWRLWVASVKAIIKQPIIGYGIESTASIIGNRPHNEFLQYAVFFGVPTCLCYILGVAAVFWRSWKQRVKLDGLSLAALIAAFGYLVSSCFGCTFHYTAPWFFLLLGAAVMRQFKAVPVPVLEKAEEDVVEAKAVEEVEETDTETEPEEMETEHTECGEPVPELV
jgi:hypothetical protein